MIHCLFVECPRSSWEKQLKEFYLTREKFHLNSISEEIRQQIWRKGNKNLSPGAYTAKIETRSKWNGSKTFFCLGSTEIRFFWKSTIHDFVENSLFTRVEKIVSFRNDWSI